MAALQAFLGSIGSAVGAELILHPGKDLYHYTDLNGLLGVLQKADLWLTHSRYSNDEEEIAHGQRVVSDAIADALKQAAADVRRTEYLEQLRTLIDKPSTEGVYICCFCQKDNLLSQWRGYGANGAGVSLQVDSGGFSDLTGADCQHGLMRFWKVFYSAETQRKIIDGAINFTYNAGLPTEQLARRGADAIQFFIPTFKNPDFVEEAEWRLIFTPNPMCVIKPRFRVRGGMLVPYYSLRDLSPAPPAPSPAGPPPRLPIEHVTVGPSASKALNVASVRMLLDHSGYADVAVEASKTPFRS